MRAVAAAPWALECEVKGRAVKRFARFIIAPPEETEHGTRPEGRGPGGVPGGVGSKNRGGMYAYTEGGYSYTEGVYPL